MPVIRDIIKENEQKVWRSTCRWTYIIGACMRSRYDGDASSVPLDKREWRDALDVYAIVTATDEWHAMRQFVEERPDIAKRAMSGWTFDKNAQRVFYCVKFDRYPFNVGGHRGYTLMQSEQINEVRSSINDETLARFVR